MYISATLSKLLSKHYVTHKIYDHPRMDGLYRSAMWHGIDISKVIDCQVLVANNYKLLVVYPITRSIDLNKINYKLNKNFQILDQKLTGKIFRDCESGIKIPFGQPYNLDVLIDKSIEGMENIYFSGGGHTSLVEMSLTDFLFLNTGSLRLDCTDEVEAITEKHPIFYKKQPLIEEYNLPEVPNVIRKVLDLVLVKDTNIHDLAQILAEENDFLNEILGSLSINSLNDHSESSDLLKKFSNLSHVVIGASTSKALSTNDLPMNELKDFWLHSCMAASLAEDLTKHTNNINLDHRISYLGGMLHNLGFILLCKLFPPEFKLLQKWQQLNPDIPIQILEKKLLGMGKAFDIVRGGHAELGEWLLRSWHVPEVICVIARQHHNLNYSQEYSEYVKIIQIANYLLKCHGIGDGSLIPIEASTLESLGLTQEILDICLARVLDSSQEIEKLTKAMTR